MIPKAENSRTNREFQVANRLGAIVDSASLSMPLVSHYLLMLPAPLQMQLIDLFMAYLSEAKNGANAQIANWANSVSIP